jgi:formylglycine-generating enzyme required for sulfatase activity
MSADMTSRSRGQPSSDSTLGELLGWLAAWPVDQDSLTASELADLLWLARTMPEAPRAAKNTQTGQSAPRHKVPGASRQTSQGSSKRPPSPPPPPPPPEDAVPSFFPETSLPPIQARMAHLLPHRVLPGKQELDAAIASLPVRLSAPPLLPPERLLLDALRPLMNPVPVADRQQLDEEATAERCAEERLPLPVYGGREEPRFSVTLLVDRGLSMEVWQPLVGEFQDVLTRSGAFREVGMVELIPPRSWKADGAVGLRPFGAQQVMWKSPDLLRRSPPPLVVDAQRSLLLVITDTAGPHWWNGLMFELLLAWSRQLPVTILHTLPRWMAERTALRALSQVEISNDRAAASSSHYLVRDPDGWVDTHDRGGGVPVLRLEPGDLAPWAAMVMGDARLSIAGVRIPANRINLLQRLEPLQPEVLAPEPPSPRPAEELWQGFCRFASPEAERLMVGLAAAPVLNLPVMRLIKEAMLPARCGPLPLQEVLLSGLVQPVAGEREQTADDTVQYSLHGGVLALLRRDLSAVDTVSVVKMVTGLVERRWNSLGTGHSFRALLRDPDLKIDQEDLKGVVNFATATAELIERLPGEQFQRFAQQLRGRSPQPVRRLWPGEMRFETHDFESAQLVSVPQLETIPFTAARFAQEELQRIEFQTATLQPNLTPRFFEGEAWAFHEPIQRDHLPFGATVERPDPLALTLVEIPGGTFQMGSPPDEPERGEDEGPQHPVTLESFFMSQAPITQAQWREVAQWQPKQAEHWERELKPNPSRFQFPGEARLLNNEAFTDSRPVEQVSWDDAMEFCSRLSQRTGRTYTLPSEAQWEYACHAGTTTPFGFGETITSDLANYRGSETYGQGRKGEFREQTTPVGMFPANAWGLQDMHGNVWEWCLDHWHKSYVGAPEDGSAWLAEEGGNRLLRGGSWSFIPRSCRSAYRDRSRPDLANGLVGFRVVCLPQGPSLNP